MGRGGETLGVGKEPGRKCVQDEAGLERVCKQVKELS